MKKLTLVLALLSGVHTGMAQQAKMITTKEDCSSITQRYITQAYSVDQQLALNASAEKLACLDYVCTRSYEFQSGQMILRSQKELFNAERYRHMRRIDQRVTIYDDYSGLYVVLYSWNEVEAELVRIRSAYQLLSCQ